MALSVTLGAGIGSRSQPSIETDELSLFPGGWSGLWTFIIRVRIDEPSSKNEARREVGRFGRCFLRCWRARGDDGDERTSLVVELDLGLKGMIGDH